MNCYAIFSKHGHNPGRIHYHHLTEKQAQDEVDRLNSRLVDRGLPAIYWMEDHHPENIYVIG